jgi:hypothetical protein
MFPIAQECAPQVLWQLIQILMGEHHAKMVFAGFREEFDHRRRGHKMGFIDIEKEIASPGGGTSCTAECGQLQLVHQE